MLVVVVLVVVGGSVITVGHLCAALARQPGGGLALAPAPASLTPENISAGS